MGLKERDSIFWDEEGFSTLGMVLALLITLALIFTAARVYEISTATSGVQEVADAAALAAENVVAEFYLVVQVSDAIVMSLSVVSVVAGGIGIACLATPVTKPAAEVFLNGARDLQKARDSFSHAAIESLSKLQKALPFLAIAKAQSILGANTSNDWHSSYAGVVILCPWNGEDIEEPSYDKSDKFLDDADEQSDELEEAGRKAEEAAQRAQEYKQEAYEHDSGYENSYCMYERAKNVAGMSGGQNPFFSSVETWSFSVALQRAKDYYAYRYSHESPANESVNEQSNSALRKLFYQYAKEEVGRGFVVESKDSFRANFPLLPKNTDEMRGTKLYTQTVFPVTINSAGAHSMHAYSGCPQIASEGSVGTGSVAQMEAGGYRECPVCQFRASSMGSVAAASSNIENGFEFHYLIVAQAARDYQREMEAYAPQAEKVKSITDALFGELKDALEQASKARINVLPPGRFGAVAIIGGFPQESGKSLFTSSFVSSSAPRGSSAALSAATLVKQTPDEARNVLNSFLDGYRYQADSFLLGFGQVLIDLWSKLLFAYSDGHDALLEGIEAALDAIPFASYSGLGKWASEKLGDLITGFGLEPADLAAPKPVVVNTSHVLAADDSGFSARLLSTKNSVLAAPGNGSNVFGSALAALETRADEAIADLSQEFEIARIEIFDGVLSIPLVIALPDFVRDGVQGIVDNAFARVGELYASVSVVRQWE